MGKEKASISQNDPFKAANSSALELTIAAGALVPGAISKAAVNAIVIEEAKDGIRYKNGRTMPTSVKRLMAAARMKSIRPSYILSDNLIASGDARPVGVAAHHIVEAGDKRARPSQDRLWGWHISLNDADNGVYLPRFKSSVVDGLENAHKHSVLHTNFYRLEVFSRLRRVPAELEYSKQGRLALQTIKQELVNGTFPYRRELKV